MMFRYSLAAALAAALLAVPAGAKRVARIFTPLDCVVRADAVVVGKVTAIEKEQVTAAPAPGDPSKLSYSVAVVKVESGLFGADNATHVRVAFIPPAPERREPPAAGAPGRAPARTGFQPVHLKEGTEGLFYLSKHHGGQFYVIQPIMRPAETKFDGYKDELALAKRACAVFRDPLKALKAEKAEERGFAALVLVNKYRAYPENPGVQYEQGRVTAEESRLILKGLTEASWKPDVKGGDAYRAFASLGLTAQDGWKHPALKPGEDFAAKTKEAFAEWLAGPGKDYQIRKWVPKK
jgi:hypothetical protein